jgi:hypothetical protein
VCPRHTSPPPPLLFKASKKNWEISHNFHCSECYLVAYPQLSTKLLRSNCCCLSLVQCSSAPLEAVANTLLLVLAVPTNNVKLLFAYCSIHIAKIALQWMLFNDLVTRHSPLGLGTYTCGIALIFTVHTEFSHIR